MQTIKIAVGGETYLPHSALEPFQGELKFLAKEQYEKLRNSIASLGFSFTVHVWQHEGHNYIIDGHQRVFTVRQMAEIEQWQVPDLPCNIVRADSFAEAKRKVLAGASQYGQVTDQGLLAFLEANDIPFDDVVATFSYPEVDFGDFAQKMLKIDEPMVPDGPMEDAPEMKSGSDLVKQVQLFFTSETHLEFMQKVEVLGKHYNTENVTDTILEVVRADFAVKQSQP